MPFKDPEARREAGRKYRLTHKAEKSVANYKYYRTHKAEKLKYNRVYGPIYLSDPEHMDQHRERNRLWRRRARAGVHTGGPALLRLLEDNEQFLTYLQNGWV